MSENQKHAANITDQQIVAAVDMLDRLSPAYYRTPNAKQRGIERHHEHPDCVRIAAKAQTQRPDVGTFQSKESQQ